jgi:biopolymer transport protein ExbD
MQLKQQHHSKKNEDDSILPLINIVFLLLIFFMIAGRLAVKDPFQVTPPQSNSEGKTEINETIIIVGDDGKLVFDGKIIEESNLEHLIVERLKINNETQIQLKADAEAEAINVVSIMELLRKAGVNKLQLLTLAKK